jgi:hypothetical protein
MRFRSNRSAAPSHNASDSAFESEFTLATCLKKCSHRRAKNTPLAFFTRYKIQRVAGDGLKFLQYPACV